MISIRNAKYAKIGLMHMVEYINQRQPTLKMNLLEIGCYVGDSTEIFADNFNQVFCVDPWENGYDENDAASYQHDMSIVEEQFDNLCKTKLNIIKMKGKSEDIVMHMENESLDVVYVDGLHTYEGVVLDIRLWLPKIKKGGFIAGHDYGSKHHPGVKKAVDEHFIPDATFKDTSWVKRI